MDSKQRRDMIVTILKNSDHAVSATVLAERLQVSRQVIVTDVALLRAGGTKIIATPRGYVINPNEDTKNHLFKVASIHGYDLTQKELYAIVDNGGEILDVIVEHPIYGQLTGQLNLSSRVEVDNFMEEMQSERVNLLSHLTDGLHLHTISCKNEEMEELIKNALNEVGVLIHD